MRIHHLWPLILLACGSSDDSGVPDARVGGPADATPDPTVLRVGGEYPTQVSLTGGDCTGLMVMSMPTRVSHEPGATSLTLFHAVGTYPGTVERNGGFVTTPVGQNVGSDTHTLTITGKFTITGFDAMVDVAVTRRPAGTPVCMYHVKWTGTRQAGVNVIPE